MESTDESVICSSIVVARLLTLFRQSISLLSRIESCLSHSENETIGDRWCLTRYQSSKNPYPSRKPGLGHQRCSPKSSAITFAAS